MGFREFVEYLCKGGSDDDIMFARLTPPMYQALLDFKVSSDGIEGPYRAVVEPAILWGIAEGGFLMVMWRRKQLAPLRKQFLSDKDGLRERLESTVN